MKIAYFDCLAGASGDMMLGALIDAGLSLEALRERLNALNLEEKFEIQARPVFKNGLRATKVDVIIPASEEKAPFLVGRHLTEIEAILENSRLASPLQERATVMFRRLAEVEAEIHGVPLQQVHLHEVGSTDTIVDVVGVLLGLDLLEVGALFASPLPLGRGFVQSAHGVLPLPAPATLALLKDVPVRGSEIEAELVTPTAALLLSTLCRAFGPIPPMRLQAVGYGAGERDLPIPNLLRVLIGEHGEGVESLTLLETNLDDTSAEVQGYVMEKLFAAGALDVFFTPIQMKKNRPATMVSVLCRPQDVEPLEEILFGETSTLGIRRQMVERHSLRRFSVSVNTPYGAVRVKIARLPDGTQKCSPEYEDCKRAAEAHGVPLRLVYEAAMRSEAIDREHQ